ncbi:unnamed protein product [Echinostoma caproni]|uniref:Endo/exonuclease/phosphatase domain-containing protein n=1 Tax=Echinostoma caproni TaxID=27848 RepID=A0A183B845_9TREM|nr:unnamed protein product [Echinostoma caproni]
MTSSKEVRSGQIFFDACTLNPAAPYWSQLLFPSTSLSDREPNCKKEDKSGTGNIGRKPRTRVLLQDFRISGLTSEDPSQAIEKSCMKAEVDNVTVWYTNACSVRGKWGELATRTQNSVIIAITETWMRHEQDVEKPRDYSAYRQDRVNGRQGGGVFLLVKAAYTQWDSPVKLATPNIQARVCSILLGRRPLGVLIVYRAPQAEPTEVMELLATLQEFISKTQRILILGDFNLPEICWVDGEAPVGTKGESFLTWLYEHALIQHIMRATRFRNQQRASALDLVKTRYLSDTSEVAVENPLGLKFVFIKLPKVVINYEDYQRFCPPPAHFALDYPFCRYKSRRQQHGCRLLCGCAVG